MNGQTRHALPLAVLLAIVPAWSMSGSADEYVVRTGYVIPVDRSLDPSEVVALQDYLKRIQFWFGENMARQGYGHRTYEYETEANGLTPRVNVVFDDHDTAYLLAKDVGYDRVTQWERLLEAMAEGGFPGISTVEGETWILIEETLEHFPDGSKQAGPFAGGSGGRDHGGQAFLGGGLVFRINRPFLADLRDYDGLIFERFGPYPLVYPTSFPGEGSTVSSIASDAQWGIAHELGHAFGDLPHQPRNRRNLMGRASFRGASFPDLFPQEDMGLDYGTALALHYNRFFNSGEVFVDNEDPTLTILTSSGFANPVDGHLEISFTASDPSGIAAAFLRRFGLDEWEAVALQGETVTHTFRTSYYNPNETTPYTVVVMDAQGNKSRSDVELTVNPGFNRAPVPRVQLGNGSIRAGSTTNLSVWEEDVEFGSENDWQGTTVEWDMDGDGAFDTPPTTSKQLSWSYEQPGLYQVIARLTDPFGAVTLSSPIGVRVFGSIPSLSDRGFVVLVALVLASGSSMLPTRRNARGREAREPRVLG